MKSFTRYLFLFISFLGLISCEKEKELDSGINNPKISSVEFDNLEIGDIMLYSYQMGKAFLESEDHNVAYTGDTLELKVIDEIGGKFLIQEQLTPGSAIFGSEEKYIFPHQEEPFQFLWEIREDSVIITEYEPQTYFRRGYLISGAYQFSLKETTGIEVEFDDWRTTLPDSYNTTEFYIKNGELNGIIYPHLNASVNFGPMEHDGDGHIMIYNKENGVVRANTISAWTNKVRGWDRIN